MSEKLVPYRSLQRQYTEAAVMIIAAGAVGLATRSVYGPEIGILAAALTFFVSIPLIALWARLRGSERVTRTEERRRDQLERAETPIWIQSIDYGALLGSIITGGVLLVPVGEHFAHLPAIAAASFLVGAVVGTYVAFDARHGVKAVQAELPFADEVSRHAFGYIIGLAAALAASTLARDATTATALMFVAFLFAKLAADILHPLWGMQPGANEQLELRHLLVGFPFVMIWWGLPLGILATLMAFTFDPTTPLRNLLILFALAVVATALITTAMALMAYAMGLTPKKSQAAADSR